MNDNSLVSIIIPVYNVEKYINQCLSSIVSQTYENIEIILVDDGSSDNSGLICDSFAQRDDRIKVIHKKNGGLSSARNAGLNICSGDYISFVDSDDFVHPQYIECMLKYCVEQQSDITVCDYMSVNKDIKPLALNRQETYISLSPREALRALAIDKYILFVVSCSKLYKRKLLDEVRFPEGRINEDEFVTYQLLYKANNIVLLDQYLYYYRRRADSIMGSAYSEKNFDGIDGMLERASFLRKHGFEEELKYTLKRVKGLIVKAENYCLNNQDEKVLLHLERIKNKYNEFDIQCDVESKQSVIQYFVDESFITNKLLIYGAGDVGRAIYKIMDKNMLAGLVDNKWFYINDLYYNVKPINELLNIDFDYICLTQKRKGDRDRVRNQIMAWGVPITKICSAIIDGKKVKFVFEK